MSLAFSGRLNAVTCIVFICLTTLLVGARFIGKIATHQPLQGADWLCLLALLLFYPFCGLILHHIYYVSNDGAFDTDIAFGFEEFRNVLFVSSPSPHPQASSFSTEFSQQLTSIDLILSYHQWVSSKSLVCNPWGHTRKSHKFSVIGSD
ncbi:hypothetical protein B0I35DRAFT_439215 [Stachybotrys elegans]|uniref:Uncharacterized protein n=1 Tax=Stachybotrys elegans TaxID=80388 RepID=A0A8K0WP30_9HYPO|nr:hypothetical protein B0I35DRAFT_439215 [Stachybotrys elegans]